MRYLKDVTEANEILTRNLDRAANLISSFKQVAVDQANSSRRKFQLHDTVTEIMRLIKASFNQKPYTIEQNIPADLEFDSYPGALSQILECVVDNAQVHAFDGRNSGKISISAESDSTGWVTLKIQDDGNGISQQSLDKVFEPFYTTRMGNGSLGLGLNIAHNVVVGILGGKIRVSSEDNQGTLVTIALPRVAPHLQNSPIVQPS